jgi:hypothetical protein
MVVNIHLKRTLHYSWARVYFTGFQPSFYGQNLRPWHCGRRHVSSNYIRQYDVTNDPATRDETPSIFGSCISYLVSMFYYSFCVLTRLPLQSRYTFGNLTLMTAKKLPKHVAGLNGYSNGHTTYSCIRLRIIEHWQHISQRSRKLQSLSMLATFMDYSYGFRYSPNQNPVHKLKLGAYYDYSTRSVMNMASVTQTSLLRWRCLQNCEHFRINTLNSCSFVSI